MNASGSTSIVTLLTDFGMQDAFVGIMKGVLLARAPAVRVVDLCHELAPGDRLAAGFQLRGALPYFPSGTVHVVVVDPGVGSRRRILAVRVHGQVVLAPDNGLLEGILADVEEVRSVENRRLMAPAVSATFHGRDVFAPVAAALATGTALAAVGPAVEPTRAPELWPLLEHRGGEVHGCVLHVDRFGNLITNVPAALVPGGARVFLGDRSVGGVRETYAAVEPGDAVAVINSFGLLEIAVRDGSARSTLNAVRGASIRVAPAP